MQEKNNFKRKTWQNIVLILVYATTFVNLELYKE